MSGGKSRLVLAVEEPLDLLKNVRDVTNFSLHAPDIVLRVLYGFGILIAGRDDLGGYVDYSNDACCARKAVHDTCDRTQYAG
jgi:hypothetical protein